MRRGTLKNFISSTDYNASKDLDRIVCDTFDNASFAHAHTQLLEAAEGLEYLHAQKVIHGDLKDVSQAYIEITLCVSK
jgi:serine/threonine protein kinase